MSHYIEVVPAYGRDYKNQREVREAWNDNKDFQETASRSYVTKEEADRLGLSVIVRYAKRLKVMSV